MFISIKNNKMESVDVLKARRKIIKSSATKLMNNINDTFLNSESTIDISWVDETLAQINDKETQFLDLCKLIEAEMKDVKSLETELESNQEYREKLISAKCKLTRKLKEFQKKESKTESNAITELATALNNMNRNSNLPLATGNKFHVNLPKLNIEKFDGNFENWQEFYSQFKSAIHDNEELNNVDKFTYLKGLLKGSAQIAIQGLTITDENYSLALQILENRYGKKEMLIRSHINKLLNLSPVRSSSNLKELRNLYDACEIHIRSLKSLGIELQTYGSLLFPIITKLIPEGVILNYNRENKDETESWNVAKLLEYIKNEIETRERTLSFRREDYGKFEGKTVNKREYLEDNKSVREKHKMPTAATLNMSIEHKCLFCSESHDMRNCTKTVEEKKNILRKKGNCFLCFKRFHLVKDCRSGLRCDICSRKHNRLICEERGDRKDNPNTVVSSVQNQNFSEGIYLQTATALAVGKKQKSKLRLLYDLGSQRSFILCDTAEKLDLQVVGEENVTIHAFGSKTTIDQKRKRYRILLKNPEIKNKGITIEVLETPEISEALLAVPGKNIKNYLYRNKLQIADKTYGDSKYFRLSILIGSDYYWQMVTGKIRRLSSDLVLSETILGWTVNGCSAPRDSKILQNSIGVMKCVTAEFHSSNDNEVNTTLRGFWDLETMGIKPEKEQPEIENKILENFNETIKFNNNRYEVRLPWNDRTGELKDNYELARKRLGSLSKKFERCPEFYDRYKCVIDSYLEKGIAETANFEPNSICYFMPHQAVIREDKTTTKLRVVFDASSHSSESISLNDCLHTGPNLNPDVLSILLKFRLHKIAVIGDIEQAFLQISLDPVDRDAVRFLWIESLPYTEAELKFIALRMTRVLFGAKPSPFLLSATLKHHIRKYELKFPETVHLLNECIYVDDFIAGVNEGSEGSKLYTEVKNILKDAGFNMRKWATNEQTLQSEFNIKEEIINLKSVDNKVLGYKWNTEEDTLKVELRNLLDYDEKKNDKVTKREVLKVIGTLYDPIGILNPFTVTARILMQEIWKSGLVWEDELKEDMRKKWVNWCNQLKFLETLKISRHLFSEYSKGELEDLQLHCFNDASAKAYGAVIYVRYRVSGQIFTNFVISKVRVAPLKELSLPRLELMSAVVGTRVTTYIKKQVFKDVNINLHFWTDSMIVLHWIKGNAQEWKPFVRNRIREVQKNSDPKLWSHCPGTENPADLLTRGERVESFLKTETWFKGPRWLRNEETYWPRGINSKNIAEVEVERKSSKKTKILQVNCVIGQENTLFQIEKFGRLSRIIRITSWILRFVNNTRKHTSKITGPLSTNEIISAEKYWIRKTQEKYFPKEQKALLMKKLIPRKSKISNLNPFLDEDNIMRLSGRLQNSNLTYSEAHPVILPEKNHFTNLLIKEAHENLAHSGVSETLVQLRERFWILKGRQQVKRIIRKCIICQKFSNKSYSQEISPLPPDRIKEALPFEVSGVDFLGPLYLRNNTKIYVALFTCAVVRAVHLEIVMNLTTSEFLMAFRRFISRRGICKIIYSDNAKTFKKADKDLQQMWNLIKNPEVRNYFCERRIEWRFIVERAAWWGGFYERLVRSTKTCLKKILGRSSLEYKEFETILLEVEAILNSRPLTFVSNEVDDPSPLCPSHFLIGKRITALPPENIRTQQSTKNELTRKYKYRLNLIQQFWKKWKQLYIMDLKSMHKSVNNANFKISKDTVVLIHEDNQPRILWKLGIISEIHPGRDGKIRACTIRLSNGSFIRRAVQHLYPLELETLKDK